MLPTIWQRLEQTARNWFPAITALVMVLVEVVAWPLPYMGSVAPSLGLVAVYYWAVHRPDLFRPHTVFVLGLLHDVICYLPLGLSALIYVAAHQLLISQRRFFVRQSFVMLWSGFAITATAAMLGDWLILSAYNGHWMAFVPALLQTVLTVALFPLPAWLLINTQRIVLSQS